MSEIGENLKNLVLKGIEVIGTKAVRDFEEDELIEL